VSDERTRLTPLELVALALLGALAAAGVIVSATAGVAGALFGGGWPAMSASAVAHAVLALPRHLADPARAWPASIRALLPGTFGFYAALLLVLATLGALAYALAAARQRGWLASVDGRERRGANWATPRELTSLVAPRRVLRAEADSSSRGRLGLGYLGRRLLRAESRHALVVFGPPQSGKSAGIAIPALLEWDGPAVASSVKTDLYAATVRRREMLGEVLVFDPYGLSPAAGNTWSPLRTASTWDGALSTALRMTAAAELDTGAVKGGAYWAAAAEQRLAPLLWAAANTEGGIGAVVRWAYGQGDAELPALLHHLLEAAQDGRALADAQAAYDAQLAFDALAGDTRSSIESTVQMLLRGYRSPHVQASARSCEITPERLLDSNATLYLIGDSHRSKLLRPLFLALLGELVDHAYHQALIHGGQLKTPLLLCLDELGNVAPLPNLGEIASTAPSHNIQLVSIFHDIAQARSRYGQQAATVINSHRARMLLPGVADLDTLRYFSELLGEQRIDQGAKSRAGIPERLPLASPERLRRLEDGHALLIYGRLRPTLLRLRAYYRDRHLQTLAINPEQK
jgi:type IV secretion system protein VirD4